MVRVGGLAFCRSWGYKGVSGSFNVGLRIPSELRAAVFLLDTTFCFQVWNGWKFFPELR